MKTIKKNNKYERVDDKTAEIMVRNGWEYCSKNEYKSQKPETYSNKVEVKQQEINPSLSDKKKRKLRKENKKNKYASK